MSRFLREQLDFFGRQAHSDTWHNDHDAAMFCRDVEDAIAVAIQLKQRIDRMAECDPELTRGQWTEAAALAYVPWYQEWYDHAGQVLVAIRRLKAQGFQVGGVDSFMKAYLRAQCFAVDFAEDLRAAKRIESGHSDGAPLEQGIDEIRRQAGELGDR